MSLKFIKLLSVGFLLTSSMSFSACGSHVLEDTAKATHNNKLSTAKPTVTVASLEPVSQHSSASSASSAGSASGNDGRPAVLARKIINTVVAAPSTSNSVSDGNTAAPSAHPAVSSSDLSSQTLSTVEAEAANANAKPPSELDRLVETLKTETREYSFKRIQGISSFALPHSITLSPYSSTLVAEFNRLELLVADRFYEYGKDYATASGSTSSTATANYSAKVRAQEVMNLLGMEIQKTIEEKKVLDNKMAERIDGVLGDLKTTSESLKSKIDDYKLLLKEVLFHADRTDSFMRYTRGTIADLNKSCDALVKLAAEEKNESCRKKHEETIASQTANIKKFQQQILSAEALMHAIYPYHRPWVPVPLTGGFLSYPKSSENNERSDVTGVAKLPTTFRITPEMLTDNVGDKENHYHKYLKFMLSDDAFKLKAAKEANRVGFESAPTTATTDSTQTSAATVAAVATAGSK